MLLFNYSKKENCLYINSNALCPDFPTLLQEIEYMRKPIMERINESPYRAEIQREAAKHPGCSLSEFVEGPLF